MLLRLLRDRRRRAQALLAAALVVASLVRVGSVDWSRPFRFHPDELGFVMWIAAQTEYAGFTRGSFEPLGRTYGTVVYGLALGTKWALHGGLEPARAAALSATDEWDYLRVLEDPARTPVTMVQWLREMRTLSAFAGVFAVLLLARAAWRLAGPEAAALAAWLAALAPGLVQVSHYYTADGLLVLFGAMTLDASMSLHRRPGWGSASYAALAIGLVLATKLSGALIALTIPWALWARTGTQSAEKPGLALVRACFSRWTLLAAMGSALVFLLLTPWAAMRGLAYFREGPPTTSLGFVLGTYMERDFDFYDWRFPYNGQPRGLTFLTSTLPYALGGPAVVAGVVGLLRGPRLVRRIAGAAFVPTALFMLPWTVFTIRLALPLAPPLLLAAASTLGSLWRRAESAEGPHRTHAASLLVIALGWTLARGVAWSALFLEPDARVQASRWLAANARDGDRIVTEPDRPYSVPIGAPDDEQGPPPWPFPNIQRQRVFAGSEHSTSIAPQLDRVLRDARFLVVTDWYVRRARHPEAFERAPLHARFYRALFAGRTGFTLVRTFDRTPTLGPIRFDESNDEALAVSIDHPTVYVFERTAPFRNPLHDLGGLAPSP